MPTVDHEISINEYDPDEIIDESAYDRNYIPPTTDSDDDHHLTTDAYTSESDSDDDNDDDFDDIGHNDDLDSEPITPENEERNNPIENEERTNHTENEERTNNTERHDPIDNAPTTNNAATTATATTTTLQTTAVENEERQAPIVANVERNKALLSTLRDKRKSLRNKSGRADYTYRFGFTQIAKSLGDAASSFEPHTVDELSSLPAVQKAIYGLLFTQMTAQKGIKKHGQSAMDALRKEFEQFRVMDVLEPLDPFQLSDELKSESLRALSVIKEKRDGRLKGRTVADGSAQKGKFSKSETGSPTAASDVVILTSMIDAYENRDVAVADVTGAYLHAHMKDFISMRFTGWAVDLLCEVNPEYTPFVTNEGKTKCLYVRCNKAIYGCVVSGMLWYELFSQTLEKNGFTINPYDFCVANAVIDIIDGTQCTIVWYGTTLRSPISSHVSSPPSLECSKAISEKCQSPAVPNTNSSVCTLISLVTARPQSTCRHTSKVPSTKATFQSPKQHLPLPQHLSYTSKLHHHSYHFPAPAPSTVSSPNSSTPAHVPVLTFSLPSVSYAAVSAHPPSKTNVNCSVYSRTFSAPSTSSSDSVPTLSTLSQLGSMHLSPSTAICAATLAALFLSAVVASSANLKSRASILKARPKPSSLGQAITSPTPSSSKCS
jgi:Reverse transcriptase (RNA-dependent DNA polymerase)